MPATETRNVPIAAMRLASGRTAFAVTPAASGSRKHPIKMTARSGGPIDHWYWGAIVHDFAGMKANDAIPVDYCHDSGEVLGYLDKFESAGGDLVVSGELVGFAAGDRVDEIIAKSAGGVPYQASIYFDATAIEELMPGASSTVNGKLVNGPAYIVRQWVLRGVAVCPYGADRNTESEFKGDGDVAIPITRLTGDLAMSTDPKTNPAQNGQKFIDAFGNEGAVWFAQGKTFEEAQALHVDKMTASNKALNEQVTKLSGDLKTAQDALAAANAKAEAAEKKVTELTAANAKLSAAIDPGEKPVSGGAGKPKEGEQRKLSRGPESGLADAIRINGRQPATA